ncbi:Transcription factor MYB3 [Acorus gramineus]|uniref:Transcription factor MYB3 n=1 Tax=Acorus gramineus TaxID=55184 RepID=A0AAV9BJR5_ACOGR|nr:Transcription factor MYB3 [Acorus gramineus]
MSMSGMASTSVVGGSYGMGSTPRTGVLELKSKRKRWSMEEDQILLDQIKKHGAEKWDRLRNVPGLNSRSSKSCRLRWLNHLRPNLKKRPFTEEEGHIVIQHQKIKEMRNKWTQIADRWYKFLAPAN